MCLPRLTSALPTVYDVLRALFYIPVELLENKSIDTVKRTLHSSYCTVYNKLDEFEPVKKGWSKYKLLDIKYYSRVYIEN